jgi:gluconolactonase
MQLDPRRCAMIIQDLQNDVIMDGGAFRDSGAPGHARQQRVVDNVRRLAEAARARGVVIIHVWFVVEPGAPGVTLNAPLFEGWSTAARWCAEAGAPRRFRAGAARRRFRRRERCG